jgi:DNA helicase-2/ATP-dependent DNA helicase PcrA
MLTEKAQPCKMIMTTFTEKAALEMRDRLHKYASLFRYKGLLYEMKICTLHSLCDEIIRRLITYIPLRKNYNIRDDLTRILFLNENFSEIITDDMKINNKYFGRWDFKSSTVNGIIPHFDKIAEELIDVERLAATQDQFLVKLAESYSSYRKALYDTKVSR